MRLIRIILPVACGLLAAVLPAQDPGVDKLQQLLKELGALDAKAWATRLQVLEQQAKAHDERAAALRQQMQSLQQQAADAENQAKAVRAEATHLQELQKLLAGLPKSAAPDAKAAAPAAAPKPDAAKAEPPKADAGKAAPAKVEPAKPDAPKGEAPKTGSEKMAAAPMAAAAPGPDCVTWASVQPIFRNHCVSCHDTDDKKGGLDLTTFSAARQGGGSGRTIVAGEPDQSRLYRLVAQQERPFMPKDDDPLNKEQIAKLRTWLEQGACEDADSVRTFLKDKETEAKAAAAAAAAEAAGEQAQTMPENLPHVALHTPARPGPIISLARSPRAPLFAMPGLQQVLLLDTALQVLFVLPCPLAHVNTVTFAADGTLLLAAGGEPGKLGQVVVYDVRTGALRGTFGSEKDQPLAAAVNGRLGLVALGGSGKQVHVFRIEDGAEVLTLKHDDFVLGLDFSPDGRWLAAADRTGIVQVWETKGGRIGQTLSGHKGAVNGIAFHRSGKLLLTAGADGSVRLWDVAEGKEKWRQQAHQGEAQSVAFGPGEAVASCGSDGRIKVFTLANKPVATSPPVDDVLYAIAFGTDDNTIVAGDWRGRLQLYDVKANKLTASTPLAPVQ